MSLTVCTGWSPEGYATYGRRFLEGWARYMDPEIELVVYGEAPCRMARGEFRRLSSIPGCAEFLAEHDTPRYRGLVPTPEWSARALAAGYNFKFDALKFCRQGFIPWHAARLADTTHLAWFDGDVVFTAMGPPVNVLTGLLPVDRAVAYLGRPPKWSEIGFQLYRLPAASPVLEAFSACYASGAFEQLKEWHSAFVFDRALEHFPGLGFNLTPGGHGAVWRTTLLGRFSDHLKGARKYS